MREGSRRWLIRGAWCGFVAAAAMLVGLRIGRPLYYSDGQREFSGAHLAAAGMLQWGTPESDCELPGPVQGRVAELLDGRLLYGRTGADGTTDLVTFDPRRPGTPPEPAYGLNTAAHELAPAVAADGSVYFASDRLGGTGGFDLYVARFARGAFLPPEPVALCNTMFDETDPAPAPDGVELVFVRVDRTVREGDHGVLHRVRLDGEVEPEPLFADERRTEKKPVDRDPVFTADGAALWFVRKEPGAGVPSVLRASRLGAEFDEPLDVGEPWGIRGLRSPLPANGTHELRLVAPRTRPELPDLLYIAQGRELYPWWPGQRTLELLLLGCLLLCALLLLLLYLGRRWRALDLLTQCILFSLLLHVLLMLWLMRVEILDGALPPDDDGGALEVALVTETAGGATAAVDGPVTADLAAMATFRPEERSLVAAAPEAAAEQAERSEEQQRGPEAEWTREATPDEVREAAEAPALADAPAAVEPARAGEDAKRAAEAAELAEVAPRVPAVKPAAKAAAGEGTISVHVPGSGVAAAERTGGASAPAPEAPAAPAERTVAAGEAPLRDAPATTAAGSEPARSGEDARAEVRPAAAAAAAAANGSTAQPALDVARESAAGDAVSAPASAAAPEAGGDLAPAERQLAGASASPSAPRAPSPQPSSHGAPSPAPLRDAPPATASAPAAASSGERPGSALAPLAGAAASGPAGAATKADRAPAPAASTGDGASAAAPSLDLPAGGRSQPAATAGAPSLPAPAPGTARSPGGAVALRDGPPAATRGASPSASPAGSAAAAAAAASAAQPSGRPLQPDKSLPPLAGASGSGIAKPVRAPAGEAGSLPPGPAKAPGSLVEPGPVRAPVAAGPSPTPMAQATPYSNRFGPAKAKALEQYGGTSQTEAAVANGLRYLARIQRADGSWGDPANVDVKYGNVNVGKTALCLLAFLGAGHTPMSQTEHTAVTRKAIAWLLARQDEDSGAFGVSSAYGHGIAAYALAECYGLTKEPALRRPVEEALTWILQNQGPRRDRRNSGGWGYFSPGLEPEDDYARLSVSSWMVMALESARLSGIDLPEDALPRARRYLENAFDAEHGWFRYNHKPSRLDSAWPTLPASTPAGAFCMMLLGTQADDPRIRAAVDFTVERRPLEYRRYSDDDFVLRAQGNVYFWYYGSLCCFLAGGDSWRRWNERLSVLLPASQDPDGSFAPIDVYARYAGDSRTDRSYTTAMCVLSLEVYYRYFTPLLLGR